MGRVYLALDEVLKARGLTQKQLAEMTGMSTSTVSSLKYRSALNLAHLARIMEALNIEDVGEILRYEKE